MPRKGSIAPEAWRLLTEQVFARDGWRCVSCKRVRPLQGHHIVPRSRAGGVDALGNIVSLCADCHERIQPQWKRYVEPFRTWIRCREVDGPVAGERPA